jgi:Winged helix-turn helix
VAERLRVREIDDDEGRRLVRIVRRGSGAVVTWRRAQMVLLSAQGMDAAAIAKVAFTSEDRVRDVIRNFNADGFASLYPRYKGGRPPKFTLSQRRDRPRQPQGAGQHDPPLHHLAQQPRLRRTAPPRHRAGKRCLKRHRHQPKARRLELRSPQGLSAPFSCRVH